MKYLLAILLVFCSFISFAQTDSAKLSTLSLKLAEYYEAMEREPLGVQMQECDFLIESTTDPEIRQHVALDIYNHYYNSPLMGAENVAIHIFDRWFAPGTVRMKSDADLISAKVYAEFNRQSLIGKPAPEITMESNDGRVVSLFSDSDKCGKFRVLYFYDTGCAKCKIESFMLRTLIENKDYPVEYYAIYAGDDLKAWRNYISYSLSPSSDTEVIHLWDPHLATDFQRKYGVQQTPRMLLVDPDGIIVGRGLDVKALETLLDEAFAVRVMEYGSAESEALFDGIFAASAGEPSPDEVKEIADYISDRTLPLGDTLMFKQLAGDYLYYLATRSGEGIKEGLRYHLSKNILPRTDVWATSDDSLKVVGFAQIMNDLLSKAVPGSKVPSLKVPAELHTARKVKNVKVRLDRLNADQNIIIFFTEGCEVCVEQKAAAKKIVADQLNQSGKHVATDIVGDAQRRSSNSRASVVMVNVDKIMRENQALSSKLMDSFDLSSLPYIMIIDSKGVVMRRYVSLL